MATEQNVRDVARVVAERDSLQREVERQRDALDFITGGVDRGPWIFVYREAGGGYEGLQAVAREALKGEAGE